MEVGGHPVRPAQVVGREFDVVVGGEAWAVGVDVQ